MSGWQVTSSTQIFLYLGALAMGLSHNRALYKRLVTLTFTMSDII